jgi:hypothetical protein
MMSLPHENFHEVWWICSDQRAELVIAHFRKTTDGTLLMFISNEPPKRVGPRVWDQIAPREGWFKVAQIEIPTPAQVNAARVMHAALIGKT